MSNDLTSALLAQLQGGGTAIAEPIVEEVPEIPALMDLFEPTDEEVVIVADDIPFEEKLMGFIHNTPEAGFFPFDEREKEAVDKVMSFESLDDMIQVINQMDLTDSLYYAKQKMQQTSQRFRQSVDRITSVENIITDDIDFI